MNFLEARLAGGDGAGVDVSLAAGPTLRLARAAPGLSPGSPLTLGIRPEHLRLGQGGAAALPLTLALTEHLGGETYFYGTLPSEESLTVEVQGQAFLDPGTVAHITLDPDLCHLFDKDGRALPRF